MTGPPVDAIKGALAGEQAWLVREREDASALFKGEHLIT